jgi:sulfide:quinone oxidoreductase
MKVDADYTPKPFDQWKASDWPSTYTSGRYANVFAVGIAFAPPHQISVPRTSPRGTVITPAPPRTGMPSGLMGRAVAESIAAMISGTATTAEHRASMAEMGAACVASAGTGFTKGTAASMTMYPVVPDFERFPEHGRSLTETTGEIGLAGHWMKQLLHHMFIYKAKAKPGWQLIPE